MSSDISQIGIIAGSGQFPRLIAQAAHRSGIKVCICSLDGYAEKELAEDADEHTTVNIGQLGKLLKFFHANGIKNICLAGAIEKPKIFDIKPDLRAAKLFFRLKSMKGLGDDALLRAIVAELADDGLDIMQPVELVPELKAPAGVLGNRKPTQEEWNNIRYGWPIGKSIGQHDIGQCLVVRNCIVVAVEAIEGTDATLERGGEVAGNDCTAIKMIKPGQDERLDMPSIGLNTIKILAKHKYTCLAYEADKTLFFDRENSIEFANKVGIAIIGIKDGDI